MDRRRDAVGRPAAPGVEVSTGPLGQGLGNAVGMAIAERWLAATFNRTGHAVVDHATYVLASDGDMMEGLSSEAGSLAGTLGLGRLNVVYDANHVTLAATTDLTSARTWAPGSRRSAGTSRKSTEATWMRSRRRFPPRARSRIAPR